VPRRIQQLDRAGRALTDHGVSAAAPA
jgi:hypothetical protein